MPFELGRALLMADAVAPGALAEALLYATTHNVALPRALVAVAAIDPSRLDEQLARADAPLLRHVAPAAALVSELPPDLCERLLAIPVRRDPESGKIDVAVVDARDPHIAREMQHWLRAPVRVLRTTLYAMEAALRRMKDAPARGMRPLAAPIWVPGPPSPRVLAKTPLYGTPAVSDLGPESESADLAPNIPIPLSPRAIVPVQIVEIDSAAIGAGGPSSREPPEPDIVVDLRRPKTPPPSAPVSHAPSTARGPFAPSAPPPPAPAIDAIRAATTRDAIIEELVRGANAVARRVAVFVVRRDQLHGWSCTPDFGDIVALRAVHVPLAAPTLLARAMAGGTHTGRLAKNDAHAPLLAVMNALPDEVAVTGVRVEGRAALVLLSCELGERALATQALDDLARAAGDALANLVRSKTRA